MSVSIRPTYSKTKVEALTTDADERTLYNKNGFCSRHPDIQLRKRTWIHGWKTVLHCCPKCECIRNIEIERARLENKQQEERMSLQLEHERLAIEKERLMIKQIEHGREQPSAMPPPSVSQPLPPIETDNVTGSEQVQSPDISPISNSMIHSSIICDRCGERSIRGVRYSCATCQKGGQDYDLCEPCYRNDQSHHQFHPFLVYDYVGASPRHLAPQKESGRAIDDEIIGESVQGQQHCDHCTGREGSACTCTVGCKVKNTTKCVPVHKSFRCDGCGNRPIQGARFECVRCHKQGRTYCLCASCYCKDQGHKSHSFLRYERTGAIPDHLAPREKKRESETSKNSRQERGTRDEWVEDPTKTQNADESKGEKHCAHCTGEEGNRCTCTAGCKVKSTSKCVAMHTGFMCDGCRDKPIKGPRFECVSCHKEGSSQCLCGSCYRKDESHKSHSFLRYDRLGVIPEKLDPRKETGSATRDALEDNRTMDELREEYFRVQRANESAKEKHCAHCTGKKGNVCTCTVGCEIQSNTSCIAVHTDVGCDGCLDVPIQGSRYECETCKEQGRYYDLCELCYQKDHNHQSHSFLKYDRMGTSPEHLAPQKQPTGSGTGDDSELHPKTRNEFAEDSMQSGNTKDINENKHCAHCTGEEGNRCTCTAGCKVKSTAKCVAVHTGFRCDDCTDKPIKGPRFECVSCHKQGSSHCLCGSCYRQDQRHKSHSFLRYDRLGVIPEKLAPRKETEGAISNALEDNRTMDELREEYMRVQRANESAKEKHCAHCTGKEGNVCTCTVGCEIQSTTSCIAAHTDIGCDGCSDVPIQGSRYECKTCKEQGHYYDLCELCYHKDHDHQSHSFLKYDRMGTSPEHLAPQNQPESSRKESNNATGDDVQDTRTLEELYEELRLLQLANK